MYCSKCGKPLAGGAAFCSFCGAAVDAPEETRAAQIPDDPGGIAARVRRNEIIVNIAWIVLGVVQAILLYTAAAGVWNIVNAIIFLVNARSITPGNPNVVPYFEKRKTGLIIAGVINVVLGGVVGVLLVLYELHIRRIVLDNAGAFDPAAAAVAAAHGPQRIEVSCPCSEKFQVIIKKPGGALSFTCPKCGQKLRVDTSKMVG